MSFRVDAEQALQCFRETLDKLDIEVKAMRERAERDIRRLESVLQKHLGPVTDPSRHMDQLDALERNLSVPKKPNSPPAIPARVEGK